MYREGNEKKELKVKQELLQPNRLCFHKVIKLKSLFINWVTIENQK